MFSLTIFFQSLYLLVLISSSDGAGFDVQVPADLNGLGHSGGVRVVVELGLLLVALNRHFHIGFHRLFWATLVTGLHPNLPDRDKKLPGDKTKWLTLETSCCDNRKWQLSSLLPNNRF